MPKTTISIQTSTNAKIQETKKAMNQLGIPIPNADYLVGFALFRLEQELNPTQEENLRADLKEFEHHRVNTKFIKN